MATCDTHSYHTGEWLARNYSLYRRPYVDGVFETILEYHRTRGNAEFELAVDVACGTGRSTLPLVPHFKKIIGVDVSEDQIAKCPKDLPNVDFRLGVGEDLAFLSPSSVDLLVVGCAAHWLQWEHVHCTSHQTDLQVDEPDQSGKRGLQFCTEAQRVLKPLGTLAVFSEGPDTVDHFEAYQYMLQIRNDKFHDDLYTEPLLKALYAKLHPFKMHGMECVRRFEGFIRAEQWTVAEYLGYLGSVHLTKLYMDKHPDEDLLGDIGRNLTRIISGKEAPADDVSLGVKVETFIMLGRKPKTV